MNYLFSILTGMFVLMLLGSIFENCDLESLPDWVAVILIMFFSTAFGIGLVEMFRHILYCLG